MSSPAHHSKLTGCRKLTGLLLVTGIVYLAITFGGSLLTDAILAFEDGRVQNYPAFASAGWLWTPLLCCGFPVMADPQVSTFYPLMQLCRLLPAGYNWYVLSGYLLSFLTAGLLAYRLSRSVYGALLAGVVYGGSGFLISELNHVQIVHTAALLPLLVLLSDIVASVRSPDRTGTERPRFGFKGLALALVTAIAVFAGHPQTCFYSLFFTACYPLFGKSRKDSGWYRHFFNCVLPVWLYIGLGILLSAVQILPSLELSRLSSRTLFTFSDFLTGQLGLNDFLGFAFPYVLGGRYGTLQGMTVVNQGPPPGYVFFGFAPLLLAIFMLYKRWREPVVRFFAVTWIFALLFVLGNCTPLAQFMYMLPGFGSFRGMYRMLLLVAIAVAILTALAISRLEQLSRRPGQIAPFDLTKMVARHGIKRHLYFMLYLILSGLSYNFLLGTLPLLIYLLAPLRRGRQALLLATVSLSLMSYGLEADWKHNVVTWASMRAPAETEAIKTKLGGTTRILTLKGLEGGEHEFLPNLSRLWGMPNASGYEPLIPWRYARLLHMAEGGFIQPPWALTAENRAFDVASVKYIIAPEIEVTPGIIDENAKEAWSYLQPDRGAAYFENKRVLPRVRFCTRVRAVIDEMALIALRTGQYPDGTAYDPRDTVLLTRECDGVASPAEAQLPSSARGQAVNLSYRDLVESDTEIKLHASLSQPAYLVMSDQYYPGWTATVDGASAHILRANICFRALRLESGEHDLVMRYEPESLRLGAGISAVALVLLLILLLV